MTTTVKQHSLFPDLPHDVRPQTAAASYASEPTIMDWLTAHPTHPVSTHAHACRCDECRLLRDTNPEEESDQ